MEKTRYDGLILPEWRLRFALGLAPDDEVNKRNGGGKFLSYEGSFADHQTTHDQGVLFPDVKIFQ
jgi:hypothetical protein